MNMTPEEKLIKIINDLAAGNALAALTLMFPGKTPDVLSIDYTRIKDRWLTHFKEQYKITDDVK